ncbi:hypothetical protein IWQ61_000463 [Dispira simplex]|nr:hypothetical protein IWQ61_000463 [Dispira simplex]
MVVSSINSSSRPIRSANEDHDDDKDILPKAFLFDDAEFATVESAAQQELYIFQWLSGVETQLSSVDTALLKRAQPRLEVDFLRLLTLPTLRPSKLLREIVGRCFVHVYLHGDTRTLLDTLQRLRTLVLAKRGSGEQRETKMAAFHILGQLFAALGDRILSQFTDFVMLGIRYVKATGEPLALRVVAIEAMDRMIQGAGRIASDATVKELVKHFKSAMADKPTALVMAACRALTSLVEHTLYLSYLGSSEIDAFLTLGFKALDTTLPVLRTTLAQYLATALLTLHRLKVVDGGRSMITGSPRPRNGSISGLTPSSPRSMARSTSSQITPGSGGIPSDVNSNNHATGLAVPGSVVMGTSQSSHTPSLTQRLSRSNTHTLLTLTDVLRYLSNWFWRCQPSREIRAGIIETYTLLFAQWGPQFLETHYAVLLQHIFGDLVGSIQGHVLARVERVGIRELVHELLRNGISSSHLSERGKILAIQELLATWIRLPSQLNLGEVPQGSSGSVGSHRNTGAGGTLARETALACALEELACLLCDLTNEANRVQDGMVGPLLTLLSYPKHTIQMLTAYALKQFLLAVPTRLPKLATRLINLLQKDIANISNAGISSGVLKRCQGYCLGLAAVVAVIPHRSLFISYEVTMWVASVANQLLKSSLTPASIPRSSQGPSPQSGTMVHPTGRTQEIRVANAQARMGWTLVAALVTLGPEFTRLYLASWLTHWKQAFNVDFSRGEGNDVRQIPDNVRLHMYQTREAALAALHLFLIHNRAQLHTRDLAKRMFGLLHHTVLFLQTFPLKSMSTTTYLLSSTAYNTLSSQTSFSSGDSNPFSAFPCTLGLVECHYLYRRRLMDCFTLLLPLYNCEAMYPWLFKSVRELLVDPDPDLVGLGDFVYMKGRDPHVGGQRRRGSQDSGSGGGERARTGSFLANQSSTTFGTSATRWGHESHTGVTSLLDRLLVEPQPRRFGFAITEGLFDQSRFHDQSRGCVRALEYDVLNLFDSAYQPGSISTTDMAKSVKGAVTLGLATTTHCPPLAVEGDSSLCPDPRRPEGVTHLSSPSSIRGATSVPPFTSAVDAAVTLFGVLFTHTTEATQISLLQDFLNIQQRAVERHNDRRFAIQTNCVLALFYILRELTQGSGRRSGDSSAQPTSGVPDTVDTSTLRPLPVTAVSMRVVQLMMDILQGPTMHRDVTLRIAACETLGLLANQAGAKFVSDIVSPLAVQGIHNRDPYARAGVALALGSIYSHAGSMTASVHLESVMVILHSLSRDLNPIVHNWGLHGLALTIDAAGLMFVPYVEITIVMLAKLFTSEPHQYALDTLPDQLGHDLHPEDSRRGLGHVLCALLGAYGPELALDETNQRLSLAILQELKFTPSPWTLLEYLRCSQQVLMFVPQALPLRSLVHQVQRAIHSPLAAVRYVGVACLLQLVKRDASQVLQLLGNERMFIELFILFDRDPTLGDVQQVIRNLLDQIDSDQLVPLADMLRAIFTRQQGQATDPTLLVSSPSPLEGQPPQDGQLDEEDTSFVPGPTSTAGNPTGHPSLGDSEYTLPQTFSTPARVLALRCLRYLLICRYEEGEQLRERFRLVSSTILSPEMLGHRSGFDYDDPRKPLSGALQQLAGKVADFIRIAFIAATCTNEQLQAEGLELLQVVIYIFTSYDDPDFPGLSLLEQFQAQITAAFTPALSTVAAWNSLGSGQEGSEVTAGETSGNGSSSSGLGADYSPWIQSLAIKLCAVFVGSGLTQDLAVLKRVLKPLVTPLHDSLENHPVGGTESLTAPGDTSNSLARERTISFHSSGPTDGNLTDTLNPHAVVVLRLTLLRAWADIYVASQTHTFLTQLLTPHLPTLCHLWLDALKDSVLIQLDNDRFTFATGSLSQSFSGLSMTDSYPGSPQELTHSEPASPRDSQLGPSMGRSKSHTLFPQGMLGATRSDSVLHNSMADRHEIVLSLGLDPTYAAATRNILAFYYQNEWLPIITGLGYLLEDQDATLRDVLTEFNCAHDPTAHSAVGTPHPFPRAEYIVFGLCVQYLYTIPKTLENAPAMTRCLQVLRAVLGTPCYCEDVKIYQLLGMADSDTSSPPEDNQYLPFALTVLDDSRVFSELWCILDRLVQLESTPLRKSIVALVQCVVDQCRDTLLTDGVISITGDHLPITHNPVANDRADVSVTNEASVMVHYERINQLPTNSKLWQILALMLSVHKHGRSGLAAIPLTMEKAESSDLQLLCETMHTLTRLVDVCRRLPPAMAADISAMTLHLLTGLVIDTPLLGRNTGLVLRMLRHWLTFDYGTLTKQANGPAVGKQLVDTIVSALDTTLNQCCTTADTEMYRDQLRCVQALSFAALLCSSVRGVAFPTDTLMYYFQDINTALQSLQFKVVTGTLQSIRLLFLQVSTMESSDRVKHDRLIAAATYMIVPELVNLLCALKRDPRRYDPGVKTFVQVQMHLFASSPIAKHTKVDASALSAKLQHHYQQDTPLTVVKLASWCLVQLADIVQPTQITTLFSVILPTLVFLLHDDKENPPDTAGFHPLVLQHLVNLAKAYGEPFKIVIHAMDSTSRVKLQSALRQDAMQHRQGVPLLRTSAHYDSTLHRDPNQAFLFGGGSEGRSSAQPKIALKNTFDNFTSS